MTLSLNSEQQAAVSAVDGDWVIISGPGSGKTHVMVERYLRMVMNLGISQRDILNLTFTSEAAKNMVERVGLMDADKVFRTFHSFCLDLLKKERQHLPFATVPTIIPVRGEQFVLIKDLLKSYRTVTSYHSLSGRISEWKAGNVSVQQALDESYDARTMDYFYALAYRDYEARCRKEGWLDFDSLVKETVALLESNDDVRSRWKRKYIAVDEAQDCDQTQLKLLQLLYQGNLFAVGDENQCQPAGTLVDTEMGQKPIECLKNGDKVRYWNRKTGHTPKFQFSPIRVARREYEGDLLNIRSGGKNTWVTPNHWVYATLNKKNPYEYLVYLMWRKDLGFRVGQVRTSSGKENIRGLGGFSSRCYEENADKAWILQACKTKQEARTWEAIEAAKFGLPTCVYTSQNHHLLKKDELKKIFKAVPPTHGMNCLKSHGLIFEHPLFGDGSPNQRYFKTVVANLVSGLFSMPSTTPFSAKAITSISRKPYKGLVYSLDVEKYHTYVADGIPVGNCIYEWRNAAADSLSKMRQYFPNTKTLFLGTNYRSTSQLVIYFKSILPVDNGLASHMVSARWEGQRPRFIRYFHEDEEANETLTEIVDRDLIDTSAIIARTNRQLQLIQRRAMSRNIRAEIIGKKNVWQENEVKHLIDLTKEKVMDQRPAATVMQELIHSHKLVERYAGTNTNAMDKSPVENMNDITRMAGRKSKATGQPLSVVEFLEWLRKITHMRRSKTSPILTLSTVHQAKGREFKHVFIVGCDQGTMPHKEGELAEESRIFFVAASRAADELTISFSKSHSQFLNDVVEEIEIFGEEDDDNVENGEV